MRLILLGAKGMFGSDALPILEGAGHRVVPADLPEADITDPASLERLLDAHRAEAVLNAAAYTDVDGAERERERAFRVNAFGTRMVAKACADRRLLLVHLSTDYVFPGTRPEGYLPGDPPGPAVNAYGESKLEGERAARGELPPERLLICRTQWLYGRHGKNFVDTMAGLLSSREEVRVVNDQWGVPTHTSELALQVAALLEIGARGVAHTVGGGGPITWYDFAGAIALRLGLPARVVPCSTAQFPRLARRPAHAWLRGEGVPAGAVRHWREALDAYLAGAPKRLAGR